MQRTVPIETGLETGPLANFSGATADRALALHERCAESHGALRGCGQDRRHQPSEQPKRRSTTAMTDLRVWLPKAVDAIAEWEATFGDFKAHEAMAVTDDALSGAFDRLV